MRSAASRRCAPSALRGLIDDVHDDGWFFDTELLVLAQRRGLRIHEVPVDWVDDPDSRVDIVRTAWDDLRGVARLAADGAIARFLLVGVLSTIAYALLFLLLRGALGAGGANIAALAITAVANTAANRRYTFRVTGREGLAGHHVRGAFVFVLTVGLTTGALAVLHGLDADAGPLGRAGGAHRREPRRDGHPLRGLPDLGVRPAAPPADHAGGAGEPPVLLELAADDVRRLHHRGELADRDVARQVLHPAVRRDLQPPGVDVAQGGADAVGDDVDRSRPRGRRG